MQLEGSKPFMALASMLRQVRVFGQVGQVSQVGQVGHDDGGGGEHEVFVEETVVSCKMETQLSHFW